MKFPADGTTVGPLTEVDVVELMVDELKRTDVLEFVIVLNFEDVVDAVEDVAIVGLLVTLLFTLLDVVEVNVVTL